MRSWCCQRLRSWSWVLRRGWLESLGVRQWRHPLGLRRGLQWLRMGVQCSSGGWLLGVLMSMGRGQRVGATHNCFAMPVVRQK